MAESRSIRVFFKLFSTVLFVDLLYNVWKPQLFAGVRKEGSKSPFETDYLVQNSLRKSFPDLTTRRSWTTDSTSEGPFSQCRECGGGGG